ncbi:hypothetical protein [Paramuribaculum intestinale]|uniref:hypothetical protein n=1 Tax=Paramuribaculum intestinale TaxID=2094151 RepID=UPI0025A9D179|nr:hypothetical protein [Paramuribaculum intestinale]
MDKNSKEKQERKVVHLQMGDQHEYFGSIEQLFCKYTKEQLGFSIYQVRNNLKKMGEMISNLSIIRVGVLQTKLKQSE